MKKLNKTLEINGHEFYFNYLDIDFREKLDKCNEVFLKKIDVPDKQVEKDEIGCMGIQCTAAFEFIDGVFGEGAAQKVFDGKRDLDACYDTIAAVYALTEEQRIAFSEKGQATSFYGNKIKEDERFN